jgi:hypothetical protein
MLYCLGKYLDLNHLPFPKYINWDALISKWSLNIRRNNILLGNNRMVHDGYNLNFTETWAVCGLDTVKLFNGD